MLAGKKILITGVANDSSIAFATASKALEHGAELLIAAYPRDLDVVSEISSQRLDSAPVVSADLTDPSSLESLSGQIRSELGELDAALHAVAFAPKQALGGDIFDAPPEVLDIAFQTSAVSYASVGKILRDLNQSGSGSLVGLDFDASAAWPVYNWMGVCKSALESVSRYLARDLAPLGIRSNLVAAGPIHTRAADAIPGFDRLIEAWRTRSPMAWDESDADQVADPVCFLLSDHSRAITGEILHVDGGYHAMAAALR